MIECCACAMAAPAASTPAANAGIANARNRLRMGEPAVARPMSAARPLPKWFLPFMTPSRVHRIGHWSHEATAIVCKTAGKRKFYFSTAL
jgi:hypothetical protein